MHVLDPRQQLSEPFEPRLARYAFRLPEGAVGPFEVSARLRFRFMPPKILRALAKRRADGLVTEAMIDRYLRIVDMAAAAVVAQRP